MTKQEHEEYYERLYKSHTCRLCGKIFNGKRSLGTHLGRTHKIQMGNYISEYIFKNDMPVCECGCKNLVEWNTIKGQFNRFINTHNSDGSNLKDYVPTQEVIDRRNDSIRKAYDERGEEIGKKISIAVCTAWEDEQKRANNITGKLKLWSDPEYHLRRSIEIKQTWNEKYDEIYEKIFTPEFGQKISIANMKRDLKRTSKEEEEFFHILENTYPDSTLIPSYWINKTEDGRKKCFDFFNKQKNLLIEYDGIYWHGLDRYKNFGIVQQKSLINDSLKNYLCVKKGISLLRVCSSESKLIFDEKSLIDNSYYYFDGEKIQKSDMVYRTINMLRDDGCEFDILSPLTLKIKRGDIELIIDFRDLTIKEQLREKYYFKRFNDFKDKNIKYLNIFGDNFYNNNEIVLSMIRNKLGLYDTKIGARECIVSEFEKSSDERDFFNMNHIYGLKQGTTKCFTLIRDGKVVAAFSLKSLMNNKNYPGRLEICRFASEKHSLVVGAFSRLLSKAKEWAKLNGFTHIMTYADLAHGSGLVYEKNGFSFVSKKEISIPYWYSNGMERFSRQMFMAKDGKSEKQLAEEANVNKVWGVGNYLYELKL